MNPELLDGRCLREGFCRVTNFRGNLGESRIDFGFTEAARLGNIVLRHGLSEDKSEDFNEVNGLHSSPRSKKVSSSKMISDSPRGREKWHFGSSFDYLPC